MTALLAPAPLQTFYDASGVPLAGGLVYTSESGTDTPLGTFTDSTETAFATNPIVLNAYGQASIWLLPDTPYRINVKDKNGVQQASWPIDGVVASSDGQTAATANNGNHYCADTGSTSTVQLVQNPILATAQEGNTVSFIAANNVTSPSVIDTGFGSTDLKRSDGQATQTGDILAGVLYMAVYDLASNAYRLVAPVASQLAPAPITTLDLHDTNGINVYGLKSVSGVPTWVLVS